MFCIGNWKMNPTTAREAFRMGESIAEQVSSCPQVITVLCPPFPFLAHLSSLSIALGGQDCFLEQKGAYTGEVSPLMLKDQGCKYVILGHSERGESDEIVQKKIRAAVRSGLTPIICIGEEKPSSPKFLHKRLHSRLQDIPAAVLLKSLLVYEPVWAISTTKGGKPATQEAVALAISAFREFLVKETGEKVGSAIPILYGGSVDKKNIKVFLKAGAQGALVGGASLKPKEFAAIIAEMESHAQIV